VSILAVASSAGAFDEMKIPRGYWGVARRNGEVLRKDYISKKGRLFHKNMTGGFAAFFNGVKYLIKNILEYSLNSYGIKIGIKIICINIFGIIIYKNCRNAHAVWRGLVVNGLKKRRIQPERYVQCPLTWFVNTLE
jgi:hypothetical protein